MMIVYTVTCATPTVSGLALQASEDAKWGLFPGYISILTEIILQHDCNPKWEGGWICFVGGM